MTDTGEIDTLAGVVREYRTVLRGTQLRRLRQLHNAIRNRLGGLDHDSYIPLGGGITIVNMLLGKVAPGGTGSGLHGILIFAVITVFSLGQALEAGTGGVRRGWPGSARFRWPRGW